MDDYHGPALRNFTEDSIPRSLNPSNYPIYDISDEVPLEFKIRLPLTSVRNSIFYTAVDQIEVLLDVDLDDRWHQHERDEFPPRYCGITDDIIRFSRGPYTVVYNSELSGIGLPEESQILRPTECSDSVPNLMGPVSLKVGHPDNLNGRWTFKGVYNDFPEYVGGTGTILVDGETQDRTDYYHIYYGPLRGGLCHGNDTGWQIRPIDETIFDIKLEIDEKKRIERNF